MGAGAAGTGNRAARGVAGTDGAAARGAADPARHLPGRLRCYGACCGWGRPRAEAPPCPPHITCRSTYPTLPHRTCRRCSGWMPPRWPSCAPTPSPGWSASPQSRSPRTSACWPTVASSPSPSATSSSTPGVRPPRRPCPPDFFFCFLRLAACHLAASHCWLQLAQGPTSACAGKPSCCSGEHVTPPLPSAPLLQTLCTPGPSAFPPSLPRWRSSLRHGSTMVRECCPPAWRVLFNLPHAHDCAHAVGLGGGAPQGLHTPHAPSSPPPPHSALQPLNML